MNHSEGSNPFATPGSPDSLSPDQQQQLIKKISWRLLPLVVLGYLMAYIDRTNVSFAALTMNADLGISAYLYGWGAGIFFLGYALFEVPSNMVLARVGARRWIARIMITWGLISGAMAFTTGPASFLVLRFLLGVAEAGFFPGIIYYLTTWFPSAWRGRVISLLFLAVPVSNAVASVLSGAILGMDGLLGLRGWQWLFLIEALPAVLLGFVVWRHMLDRPADARWLTPTERAWLEAKLAAEREQVEGHSKLGLRQALTDRRVLTLSLIYLTSVTASYGLVFFLPQIIKGLGQSNFMTGVFTAVPYTVGIIGLLWFGRSSDRRNERFWHLIAAMSLAGVGLLGAAWFNGTALAIIAMCVVTVGLYGSRPSFWPLPSLFLTGTAAAAGIALINSLGNLGGYVGPFIVGWIKDSTQSFEMGLYFLAGCAFASALLTYLTRNMMRPKA